MPRALKVFAATLSCSREEASELGMRPHSRQLYAIVATATKKEAADKFGLTQSEARDHMTVTGNTECVEAAMSKPGQVFAYSIDYSANRKFIEIERRPHVPIPRPKRRSFAEMQAIRDKNRAEREARRFNTEELEYLVDRFSMANDPVGQSIIEKARKMMEERS